MWPYNSTLCVHSAFPGDNFWLLGLMRRLFYRDATLVSKNRKYLIWLLICRKLSAASKAVIGE